MGLGHRLGMSSRLRRVMGGSQAEHGAYPWMVYIESKESDEAAKCGGTIIHKHWMVTAAHCCYR